jgi:hypothetical protein
MMGIKEIVRQLIKKHKSNDPFQIAKEKNIIILFAELGNTLGFLQFLQTGSIHPS